MRNKIIYVDPQSYNNLSKYDSSLLCSLKEFEIIYACSTNLDRDVPSGIKIKKIFSYNGKNKLHASVSYIISLIKLFILAAFEKPKLIHIQWTKLPFFDYIFICLSKVFCGSLIFYTAHNAVPHNKESRKHYWLKRIYNYVDCIFVHDKFCALEIKKRFKVPQEKLNLIKHGLINLESSGEMSYEKVIEEFYNYDGVKFCFFGRGSKYKGLDVLLEAWSALQGEVPGMGRLLVIGKMDPELKLLIARISQQFQSTLKVVDDFVDESDLFYAVRNADAVVFPYKTISQSGALLSSIGLRVPVVVSDVGGLVEPFSVGQVGWIVKPNSKSLGAKLKYLVSNGHLIKEVKENQSLWCALDEYYDWGRIGESVSKIYKRVISEMRQP